MLCTRPFVHSASHGFPCLTDVQDSDRDASERSEMNRLMLREKGNQVSEDQHKSRGHETLAARARGARVECSDNLACSARRGFARSTSLVARLMASCALDNQQTLIEEAGKPTEPSPTESWATDAMSTAEARVPASEAECIATLMRRKCLVPFRSRSSHGNAVFLAVCVIKNCLHRVACSSCG
jgi:hypothetical protein